MPHLIQGGACFISISIKKLSFTQKEASLSKIIVNIFFLFVQRITLTWRIWKKFFKGVGYEDERGIK
jgi:hypothetical protein